MSAVGDVTRRAPTFLSLLALASLASLMGAACGGDEPAANDPGAKDDVRSAGEERGPGSALPRAEGRAPRRLSISELDATLRTTFGKSWELDGPTPTSPKIGIFPILGPMLGQPDYLTENFESLEPTPLFAKFMDNMAAHMCVDAVLSEVGTPPPDKPVIIRWKDDVDKNLRYLRLRFHGVWVPDESTAEIEDLRALYRALFDNSPSTVPPYAMGWIGVCIAMVTDPEFMTY